MNELLIRLVCFAGGYFCGIATIVILAQVIKKQFGIEGAKKLVGK